jgi:Cu-processing system permease protein
VNLSVMTVGLYLTLVLTGRRVDARLLAAIYPIFLGLALVVAFAMLFSTVSSSAALASVLTVGVVVAGRFSDVVRNMREVAPGVPAWAVNLLYEILPNFRNFDFKDRVAYGDPVPPEALAWVTVYGVAYTAIVLLVGLAAFRSRDFQ